MKKHILIFSHEFPNAVHPVQGTFIERPLAYYPDDFEVKVIAPVPFFSSLWHRKQNCHIPLKESIAIGKRSVEVFRPRYILFPRNVLRCFIGWLEYALTLPTVKRLHQIWKIDLIHVHFAYPDGVAVKHICSRLKIKYVVSEHQGAIGKWLQNRYLKEKILDVYRFSERTFAVSEFTKQQILKSSSDIFTIDVVPNGVQTDRFRLTEKKTSPQNLIYIGNLIPSKGIQLLLHALARLKQDNFAYRLVVIGDGNFKSALMTLTKHLKLDQEVVFLGRKTPNEISELLPKADIFVLPSYIESFSVVLIEAMAAGLAVIATKSGGPEEIVTPETGILIETNSTSAIVSALKTMYENWNVYKPEIIRRYVCDRFDITKIVLETCLFYTNIIEKSL